MAINCNRDAFWTTIKVYQMYEKTVPKTLATKTTKCQIHLVRRNKLCPKRIKLFQILLAKDPKTVLNNHLAQLLKNRNKYSHMAQWLKTVPETVPNDIWYRFSFDPNVFGTPVFRTT